MAKNKQQKQQPVEDAQPSAYQGFKSTPPQYKPIPRFHGGCADC